MALYDLRTTATLLGTGRTSLCRELRARGIFDGRNLPGRAHVAAGRFHVELKSHTHCGLGREVPYGKTLVTERGLMWLANVLGRDVTREVEHG